jgi:tRNA(Ile)-lysidine synthetase-like protein
MATFIRDFWLANPDYWIAIGDKRIHIDRIIYDRFRNHDYAKEDDLGKVIFLDQFVRHFSRIDPMPESEILKSRIEAINIVKSIKTEYLINVKENELIWHLMPWKHVGEWDPIFMTINSWLSSKRLTDFPILNKFFMDTYEKAYDSENVAKKVVLTDCHQAYDPSKICEVYPKDYDNEEWINQPAPKDVKPLLDALRPYKQPLAISLSGGVDSMLMTTLLKKMKAEVVAIHIIYGNRQESLDERNFLAAFCKKLGVPFYTYTVEWLKRGHVDRAFYERATRDLRFHAYKAIGRPVLLGHIQEDVVENIWTNLANGNHLDNLKKLAVNSMEEGVAIYRPWLKVKKSAIYKIAELFALPYLKNTTPLWSNRGKFREAFHNATVTQYGPGIDEKMLEVADRYQKQSELLDTLLYQPILNSWDPEKKRINVTFALTNKLDGHSWQRILKDLNHSRMGIGMPGLNACNDFALRLLKGLKNGQLVRLSKNFALKISMEDGQTWLQIS